MDTREMLEDWENPTSAYCSQADKNDAVEHYTLPKGEKQIFASCYQIYLPTEAKILHEIQA